MNPWLHQTVVCIFVRCPVPGRVKTRLARDLGDEAACDLYRAMVADLIANVLACGMPLFLCHDGDSADLPPEWVAAAATVIRQEGDTLGERMRAAFENAFAAGAGGVILTGSDIPGIDAALLRSARQSIERHAVVFAPALDGGYCLVASRKDSFKTIIFRDIPWSTPHVLEMTLTTCSVHGLPYALLEPCRDIDTLDDLSAYCRNPSASAPVTNAWLTTKGLLPSHH